MWMSIGRIILKYRIVWLLLLAGATAFFGWQAAQVKLSYEFSRAIPTDNPKYIDYQAFRKQFGEDGNLLVIGIRTPNLFTPALFNDYRKLQADLKGVRGVEDILSAAAAINLVKNYETERLQAAPIAPPGTLGAAELDSVGAIFRSLPFYQGLLYNPETGAYLMGVRINGAILNSADRSGVVNEIVRLAQDFGRRQRLDVHLSGLPYIRTVMADRVQEEMRFFLVASVVLSALILLLFFRSLSAMLLSLAVVIIGVIWSVGTVHMMGYKITLLTALIPPLVVVIGIPNCIYFLNKFHAAYAERGNKREAILQMVSKMGVVTLFCNIAAAIGFAVFALTSSQILKEFGAVAGLNILLLFFISLIAIPAVLSLLPDPKPRHMRYLNSAALKRTLGSVERWSLDHRRLIFGITAALVVVAVLGVLRLRSVGYIVDDLPKEDRIYTDLKFFESNFGGVMPLEIVVDTKRKYGVSRNLDNLLKIDSLSAFLAAKEYIGRPLSLAEGLKFAKQAFFDGDSTYYSMPSEYDLPALAGYLNVRAGAGDSANAFAKLTASFMDSSRQVARISASMKDVGSDRLPLILDSIQNRTLQLFDTGRYAVRLTGSSVTFLEGSRFIIGGLKESILWAFGLIALCMLYLFRSGRILLCSLLPNVIPLLLTAGVMGWAGVALKPSTVLVFSVALGIAIDITIRFLVNYKQQREETGGDVRTLVVSTIHSTGLSIIYTSIVLIAGFIIFCFSGFGGTKALGWLTSLTLVTATVANLVLLPALLLAIYPKEAGSAEKR